ncbi:MAG: cyclic pyranopterin monophosphate synthase MoaC [bacterium]
MAANDRLTHLDRRGAARMVEVSAKPASARKAVAEGWIRMRAETVAMIRDGAHSKGDVLATARIAGIMAAKRTAELVPLCHPIMLTGVTVELDADGGDDAVHCVATATTCERTGVEMEALCAVQIALTTIYDMCKAVDRAMKITDVRLVHKSGGKSGEWNRADESR